jgi:hypothetical protein
MKQWPRVVENVANAMDVVECTSTKGTVFDYWIRIDAFRGINHETQRL